MLLIDAGNTRLKWAVAMAGSQPGQWAAHGACPYDALGQPPAEWRGAAPVWVSNVAGDAVNQRLEEALQYSGIDAAHIRRFASAAACAGVSNGYRDPTQLGSDRFASLVGARYRYPSRALLVVTCGTATTIDALDAGGRFIGGMILPGLLTMAKSLAVNTARLPEVSEVRMARQFADNTRDAIVSGCLTAQAAAIAQGLRSLQSSDPGARCLLSGGAADYIAPHVARPERDACERIDNLVLLGLHVAALEA